MAIESLSSRNWDEIIDRLGGAGALEQSARETKAFLRPRRISCAVDLLRLILAYCLGEGGFRSTVFWAAAVGLADISNVALLQRLRRSGDWLALLVGQALAAAVPPAGHGRVIRIIDATNVPKAGAASAKLNRVWRVHACFSLPAERFDFFDLTDQHGGETIDRIPVVTGEIRLADRAYLQPDRIGAVIEAGADVVVRAAWSNARWLDDDGEPLDLIGEFRKARDRGLIDRPIRIARKNGKPIALRLIAAKLPPRAAEAARRRARKTAKRRGFTVRAETLEAADWVIIVTSLPLQAFPALDVLSLYRLRWRIELAFKRLKSLIGLNGPPGVDELSARSYVLAHLLIILLLEPLKSEFEDSPRWAEPKAA